MVNHKEFHAWITVDGIPLPEYSTVIEGNKATCFIPSEAGKTFVVHWMDEGSMIDTAGYILIDGRAFSGRFLDGIGETYRSGARTGASTERPFMFAEVPSNASPGSLSDQESRAIGTIELKIMQAKVGPKQPNKNLAIIPSRPLLPRDSMDKTGGHYATFREEERACFEQMELTQSIEPLDSSTPHSYVKFAFYYRSVEWLRERGLAMLPPGTPPPISKVLIGRFSSLSDNIDSEEAWPTGFSEPVAADELFAEYGEEGNVPTGRFTTSPGEVNAQQPVGKKVKHRFASEREKPRVRNQTSKPAKTKKPEKPSATAPEHELSIEELLAKFMPDRLGSPPGESSAQKHSQKSPQSHTQSQHPPPFTSALPRQQSNLAVPSQPQAKSSASNAYILPAKSNTRPNLRYALVNPPGERPRAVIDTRIYMYESVPSSPSENSSDKTTEPPRTPPFEGQGMTPAQAMPASGSGRMPMDLDYRRLTGPGVPGLNSTSVARLDAAAARQHAQPWQRPPRSEQRSTYTDIPISDGKQSSRYSPDNIDYDS